MRNTKEQRPRREVARYVDSKNKKDGFSCCDNKQDLLYPGKVAKAHWGEVLRTHRHTDTTTHTHKHTSSCFFELTFQMKGCIFEAT